jgi:hypothetical protein
MDEPAPERKAAAAAPPIANAIPYSITEPLFLI